MANHCRARRAGAGGGGGNIWAVPRPRAAFGGGAGLFGGVMPEWWLEAVLPGVVFTLLFVVWVALPPRDGETDLGARLRRLIRRG